MIFSKARRLEKRAIPVDITMGCGMPRDAVKWQALMLFDR
jgi:hypothetical protein